jgi:diguanylate cyclase (GGDEF)-like protein/PAS domain S-box-containing protein
MSQWQLSLSFVFLVLSLSLIILTLLFTRRRHQAGIGESGRLARKQLVDALIDAVLAIDLNGMLYDLNPAAEQVFGVISDQVIGQPITQLLNEWEELAQAVIRPPVTQTRLKTVHGANGRWYDIQITPLTNRRGQLTSWLIVLHDITRQKEAELQRTRLAAVIEQAQEMIVITDLTGKIEYANPYFEIITGYSRAEASGQNPRLLKSGLQDQEFYKNLWQTIRRGEPWQGNFINRRKDGSLYDEAATIFPIKDENGQIINFAAVKRDVTAQVEAERAIQESERRYRLLADNASDVIWTMNLEGRFTYISPSVEALRGYTPAEVLQQSLRQALSPQSADIAEQIFAHALANIQANREIPQTMLELEQSCKNGGYVWTESRISILHNDEGQVIGLLGVTRDIQARKQAEAERANELRQQELLNEITQAAIAEMDFQAMVQILADRLGELLQADGCYITLWDEQRQAGIPTAAYGPMRHTYRQAKSQAQPGEPTLTRHLHQTRQTLVVPDVFNTPYLAPRLAARFPTRSMLCLPLIVNHRFLGCALISFHEPHSFTQPEIQLGELAARQAALAVFKGQLLIEAERRATEAETLRQIGAAVASTLHQKEAIERILQELNRVVPYDSAAVMLLRGDELEIVGQNGFVKATAVLGLRFAVIENTPNAIVFQTRQVHILEDAPQVYPAFRRPPADHIHGWMGVPILVNDELIGMIALDSRQPGAFTQEHARLAAAFADHVGIALENSRLFEETQRLAITDLLTGLFNRRHFMTIAEREYQRASRYQYPLCVIMLDIDHFKLVNDTYGHQAGDQALQDLAMMCTEQLRVSDTMGRYGGEELIILLPETRLKTAAKVAERLRQRVSEHLIHTERAAFRITISVGIAQFDIACHRLEDLIDHADQALYQAKNAGRNRVMAWEEPCQPPAPTTATATAPTQSQSDTPPPSAALQP